MCANTFPWIEDKEAALRLWYQFLLPGGLIGIHTPAQTAYVGYVVLRKVFERYDVKLEPSNRIGAIETFQNLFANAKTRNLPGLTPISFSAVYPTFEHLKIRRYVRSVRNGQMAEYRTLTCQVRERHCYLNRANNGTTGTEIAKQKSVCDKGSESARVACKLRSRTSLP